MVSSAHAFRWRRNRNSPLLCSKQCDTFRWCSLGRARVRCDRRSYTQRPHLSTDNRRQYPWLVRPANLKNKIQNTRITAYTVSPHIRVVKCMPITNVHWLNCVARFRGMLDLDAQLGFSAVSPPFSPLLIKYQPMTWRWDVDNIVDHCEVCDCVINPR